MDAAGVAEAAFAVVDSGSSGGTAHLGQNMAHLLNEPKQGNWRIEDIRDPGNCARRVENFVAIAKYTLSSGR